MGLVPLEEEEDTPDLLLSALGGHSKPAKGALTRTHGTLIMDFPPPKP